MTTRLVRMTGLEPARQRQRNLNPPSLPIPPHPHIHTLKRVTAAQQERCVFMLRCPIKSSGLRISSILSTAATRSGRFSRFVKVRLPPAIVLFMIRCALQHHRRRFPRSPVAVPGILVGANAILVSRPLPLAHLAASATGGARLAPHHIRMYAVDGYLRFLILPQAVEVVNCSLWRIVLKQLKFCEYNGIFLDILF